MRETGRSGYMNKVKKKLKTDYPQCEIRRLDPNEIQGSPDLLILCPVTWATLEVKKEEKAIRQPNQDYYVDKHNKMAYSSMIFPENEKEVFNDLNKHFKKFNGGEQ